MRETALYSRIRPHLMSWGICDRVENTLGSGMSDVYYNIGGKCGWIETKIAKGDCILFEKFQLPWMGKHVRQNGKMWVCVLDKDNAIRLYRGGVVTAAPRAADGKFVSVHMGDLGTPSLVMKHPYKMWSIFKELITS